MKWTILYEIEPSRHGSSKNYHKSHVGSLTGQLNASLNCGEFATVPYIVMIVSIEGRIELSSCSLTSMFENAQVENGFGGNCGQLFGLCF